MSRAEDLIARIEELGIELEFYGPQSRESISALAAALGVTLPPSYVAFLETYGGGGVGDRGISGIFGDEPLRSNYGCAYGDTMRWREQHGLPHHFVVLRDEDGEEAICLDTRHDPAGESAVVRVDLFGGGKPVLGGPYDEAASFQEFFESYLELWTVED